MNMIVGLHQALRIYFVELVLVARILVQIDQIEPVHSQAVPWKGIILLVLTN